jgi:serine/threonine protein kinase
MEELVGQSLGRFRIISLLGEGGMGAVFKGHDAVLQRDLAIKVMHPQFARQPNFQERFLQEARTAARLSHPGIVQVYDFGYTRSLLYIVMEFIPGDNLRKMLNDLRANGRWILLPEAIELTRQVCLALNYAHHEGVLHRDIKPDNIMIRAEKSDTLPYRPVITDLGLAKLVEGGVVTQEGSSMGTPAYMSPEQALGQPTDARSDIYSLGILLYELTVGGLPFPIRTITEAIRYHTKEAPPRPRSVRLDLPESVERVILQAMAKNPVDRFPDAAAMATALSGVTSTVTAVEGTPTSLGASVSLMTQYQQSLVAVRGPSLLADFPSSSADLTQDRIVLLAPDRSTRPIPLKPGDLTIGRSADNGLVIDHPKVSRKHAQVHYDGQNYTIMDLDSSNGTFFGNVKLLPGVPQVWTPDKVVRIGDHWLRLERVQSGRPSTPDETWLHRFEGTMLDQSLQPASPTSERIGVFVEATALSVAPGSSVVLPVSVLNQGQVVDHFQVTATGVPADWLPASPPTIQLLPGAQQEVKLTIQPPRAPTSQAGRYPLAVRVASLDAPDQVAQVPVTLTVAPYAQFRTALRPQAIRTGQKAQVVVENQGNAQTSFTLDWQDRANALLFKPGQAQVTVSGGQTAAVEFQAVTRQQRWIGSTQTYPFSVEIAPSGGQPQTQSGEVASRGLIPLWMPLLLFLACACLSGLAAFAYEQSNAQQVSATQTAVQVIATLVGGQTALASANQATVQAAAATAAAQAAAATAQAASQAAAATAQAQATAVGQAQNVAATAQAQAAQAAANAAAQATQAAANAAAQATQAAAAGTAQAQSAAATAQAAAQATAAANPSISVSADQLAIQAGKCTTLHWNIQHVKAVYLDGDGVNGMSQKKVCPSTTTTYTWRIVKLDASEEQRTLTIQVMASVPTVIYDFIAQAPSAHWSNSKLGTPLPFNGSDVDPKGFVLWRDNTRLEDGSQPARVLETHPQWVDNGHIYGNYTLPQSIKSGDHFKAKVGFMSGAGGSVTFQVMAAGGKLPGGGVVVTTVSDSGKDGQIRTIDADLSGFAGGKNIILVVNATNPAAGQDWAVWEGARIEH